MKNMSDKYSIKKHCQKQTEKEVKLEFSYNGGGKA